MPDPIVIIVEGEPIAQPRVKAARIGGFVRMYTPKTADAWKKQVLTFARLAMHGKPPIDGPVRCDFLFYMPRPQRLMKKSSPTGLAWHSSKPDYDNLAKAATDAMTEAGVWHDDGQVCDSRIRKFYAGIGYAPGCRIEITPLVDVSAQMEVHNAQ